ncbi:MAG: Bifunctional ligase/repressor BirA [Cryomorphaceae bacterium]|nr:MAG: Bifunctional ligase/repressor BirA [Cryomorphaceae bacterium]
MFTKNHIKLETINSTNDYALSLKDSLVFKEGLVVTASYQSGGNGQRGKAWESNANENLLLSVVIEPKLKLDVQFLISIVVALSVCDLLKSLGIEAEIKWPNDILVAKQKIAGILIQNKVQGNYITHSVIGLGFNVNQLVFKDYSLKATSLRLQQNKEYEVLEIQEQFLSFLSERLKRLKVGENQENECLNSLFLKDKPAAFGSGNKQFMGIIKGVSESGKLLIKLEDDSIAAFENQQVKYLF